MSDEGDGNPQDLHIVLSSTLEASQGGRETWLEYFVPEVARHFSRVFVHGRNVPKSRPSWVSPGVEVVSVSRFGTPGFLVGTVVSLLRRTSADSVIIYCGVPFESTVALVSRWLRPKALHIGWARGGGVDEVRAAMSTESFRDPAKRVALSLLSRAQEAAFRNIDFIFNGDDTRARLADSVKTTRRRIVIPNALPVAREHRSGPWQSPISDDGRFHVGYVGRLVTTKGFEDYMDLAARFRETDAVKFHAWGPNVGAYAIPDSIAYHGPLEHERVSEVLKLLDAVVFLNRNQQGEASGVSHGILEAMNDSRIIIGWLNPTQTQLLDDSCALLVAEGDHDELEVALKRAMELTAVEVDRMEQSLREVVGRYTVQAHTGSFLEFISSLRR